MNYTLVDESGAAVRIDFWGDQADNVHKQLQDEVALAPVGICFTFLAAQKDDRRVRPYKKLSATTKTIFSNAEPASPEPSVQQISERLYVSNFTS